MEVYETVPQTMGQDWNSPVRVEHLIHHYTRQEWMVQFSHLRHQLGAAQGECGRDDQPAMSPKRVPTRYLREPHNGLSHSSLTHSLWCEEQLLALQLGIHFPASGDSNPDLPEEITATSGTPGWEKLALRFPLLEQKRWSDLPLPRQERWCDFPFYMGAWVWPGTVRMQSASTRGMRTGVGMVPDHPRACAGGGGGALTQRLSFSWATERIKISLLLLLVANLTLPGRGCLRKRPREREAGSGENKVRMGDWSLKPEFTPVPGPVR
jgi:hypothetical protein